MKKKIANVVFALLIVTSGVTAFSGNAAAVHDCSSTDALVMGFTFGHVNKDKCTNNHVSHAVENVRDAETIQDKTDLHAAAAGASAKGENYNVLYDNYLQDTETVAWSKAEKAIAQAYENGSSKAMAKSKARTAIDEYYAKKQVNLIRSWNTTAHEWDYIYSRAEQENFDVGNYESSETVEGSNAAIIKPYFLHKDDNTADKVSESNGLNDFTYDSLGKNEVTLTNGTVVESTSYRFKRDDGTDAGNIGIATDNSIQNDVEYDYWRTVTGFDVSAPEPGYSEIKFVHFNDFQSKYTEIENKSTNLKTDAGVFTDGIWSDLQDGNIQSQDVISRNTLMFEYGTSAASGNGTYYDSIGALSQMGLASPNLDSTGQMTVTVDETGNTYQGMLFANNVPNGQWEIGKSYNSKNITGSVFMATTSGNMKKLTRNFTVDNAVDKTGKERQTVSTQTYNYKTANTSELNSKYDKLLKVTSELQNRSNAAGSGGSVGSSSSPQIPAWLEETYLGIPLWGIIVTALAGLYVVQSGRNN
ncbi:VP1 spike protein [Haloarcula virus Hardyhisp2]|uniref:VP1 spike protein n=1 Tax=Haloarcula virus Hardyhisp2 TaxID=2811386 RepID=A0A898KB83_9VIRU|nr:VP1 spike protein [Haloarcula virus Hardyhisp2]QSJ05047.1 VP1 spike protein [Haloarcula virus Hardyhisp2]